jgi:hypothetical protein
LWGIDHFKRAGKGHPGMGKMRLKRIQGFDELKLPRAMI